MKFETKKPIPPAKSIGPEQQPTEEVLSPSIEVLNNEDLNNKVVVLEDADFRQMSMAASKEDDLLMRLGALSIQHSDLSAQASRAREDREKLCVALESKYRINGKRWRLNLEKKAIEIL